MHVCPACHLLVAAPTRRYISVYKIARFLGLDGRTRLDGAKTWPSDDDIDPIEPSPLRKKRPFSPRLILRPPRRSVLPMHERVRRPLGGLVLVAFVAGIRNLQAVGEVRINEMERVASDVHVGDRLRDLGHVAGDALAAGA